MSAVPEKRSVRADRIRLPTCHLRQRQAHVCVQSLRPRGVETRVRAVGQSAAVWTDREPLATTTPLSVLHHVSRPEVDPLSILTPIIVLIAHSL